MVGMGSLLPFISLSFFIFRTRSKSTMYSLAEWSQEKSTDIARFCNSAQLFLCPVNKRPYKRYQKLHRIKFVKKESCACFVGRIKIFYCVREPSCFPGNRHRAVSHCFHLCKSAGFKFGRN